MSENETVNDVQPLSVLSTTGRFGIKGVRYFAMVTLLFGAVNIVILVITLFRFWAAEKTTATFAGVLLVLAFGIIFTVSAFYLTYRYLIMDGLKLVYSFASPFFRKLSELIVSKFGDFFTNKMNIQEVHITRAFNVGNTINEVYGQKVPRTFQKGINFLMKRIPFADIVINVKNGIKERDDKTISVAIYQQIDSYITYSLLGSNSMKWVFWLFPLNLAIQILVIYFLVG